METTGAKARAVFDRVLAYLTPYASRCSEAAVARFRKQPQVASAVIVVILGLLAIVTGFPTKAGSTTLAGALFGAGAAFIGAWVAETNRTAAEKVAEVRRMEAARAYFTPELARNIGRLVWVL